MNKQAAVYARVSTDDQAERGYSLPSQIEACVRFANQKGFDIAEVYQDDISGAKPISSRPNGYELQRAIDSRQIKAVIIYCVDRLSRDIVDLLTTVRDWLRAGIEIYALDVGQVTSELDIVLVIKGWQGSDERQKIRERTTRGKLAKAKAGKVVGLGKPPYGYTFQDGELFINEPQAQIVRMIFDLYVNGDENGRMMNLVAIAKRLTEMGIPTPSRSKGLNSKRARYASWVDSSVNWILASETYCGVLRYGKEIGNHGDGGKRPEEEQVIIRVPAIVTRELWEVAQHRRAYNSKIAKRKMKQDYLLRSLLFCGCGRRMVGTKGRYVCTGRYKINGGEEPCQEPLISSGLIESVTWNYIMKLIKNPQEFEQRLRQAQANEAAKMQPKQKELNHVIALLAESEREADQIANAAKKVKGLVGERLQRQADEVNRSYEALLKRQSILQESLAVELTENTINNMLKYREAVALGLENPTKEDRRRWLELLQVSVTVQEQKAVITCRISSEPFAVNLASNGREEGSFLKAGFFQELL